MGFPFNYKGKIRCNSKLFPDVEWFQREFLRRAKERLEIAKADLVVHENEISFATTAKAFPYWFNKDAASLANVPKGILFFDPNERTINYVLNFNKPLAIFSVGIVGVFGAFFIFVVKGPLLLRSATVFFMWLFMMLVTFIGGIIGFKQFSNRIVREMRSI
jgi:hypothetical protein